MAQPRHISEEVEEAIRNLIEFHNIVRRFGTLVDNDVQFISETIDLTKPEVIDLTKDDDPEYHLANAQSEWESADEDKMMEIYHH